MSRVRRRSLSALLATAALGAAALLWTRGARYFPLQVEGESMRPTLPPGARVVAGPVSAGDLRSGRLVLAMRPDRPGVELVKRIQAGPGDTLVGQDGQPAVLQPDEFFLVGDDPTRSTDSRHFGPVRRSGITAVLHWRYWPWPPRKL